jgi:hypothetical protein
MRICVGILNTDRPTIFRRLAESLLKYDSPDLNISYFVFDDSNDISSIRSVSSEFHFNFIHTGTRIGVARNSNHAIRVFRNFDYSILINNDCEALHRDWVRKYYDASQKTGIQHLCFRQTGIWGAGTNKRPEFINTINDIKIKTIYDFPQGALLTFTPEIINKIGYFDAKSFRGYGKAHWHYSLRVSLSGIQREGIHDIEDSNKYFKVHNEISVTEAQKRIDDYKRNTEIYDELKRKLEHKLLDVYTGDCCD